MSKHVTLSPEEAADRLAIRELVEAYAHCADRRDAKGQMALFTADTLNADKFMPEASITLKEFVDEIYLVYIEEKRASTKKGYAEIWKNHICDRVGHIQLREFRTVHASRMLRAIADENDLSKTTLQHIKAVLSGIFTHAKNEGAFDGANPIPGCRIPTNTREPEETYAYNLAQICRFLESLPLLPKAIIATAAFAGLREGELRGLNGRILSVTY